MKGLDSGGGAISGGGAVMTGACGLYIKPLNTLMKVHFKNTLMHIE